MNDINPALIAAISEKFQQIGQDPNVHLEGLVWNTPITYWDYVHTDALLNLQIQRSRLPDEMVFIIYHQINELLFKMILWEIDQVAHQPHLTTPFFTEKLNRISRYFDMLAASFTIMGDGMDVGQYLQFRTLLTPASGFQSAQYRWIEFASTDLLNLIDYRYRATIDRNTPFEHAYNHLYWQAAGIDPQTKQKTTLMRLFEQKYKTVMLQKMETYNTINLWHKFKQLPLDDQQNPQLIAAMRHYDRTVNITWVMAHYHAASKYLDSNGTTAEATGGSDWKKYMHPRTQRRIFFPQLWSAEEWQNWGIE
ncbi:MAG: tryptophan 2,3-dioxygenase [Sphingobacteriales bacterium]|nr:tryptophan 2,3-dioxygenase [Sphingobacteriales bacterium]